MDGILVNLVLEWTLSELWAISDLKIKDPSHFGDILTCHIMPTYFAHFGVKLAENNGGLCYFDGWVNL